MKNASSLATEALSYLALGALLPFGRRHVRPRPGVQPAVVFIHGYGHNASAFLPMQAYLRRAGFRRFAAFNYATRPVMSVAADLAAFLEREVPGRVHLIGHSLGGLVARAYVQKLGGQARVRSVVTLATPHGGSRLSRWAGVLRDDLRSGGALLTELDALPHFEATVRWASIGGGADLLVEDEAHTRHPLGEHFHFPDLAHVSLLLSPRVFRAVERVLARP